MKQQKALTTLNELRAPRHKLWIRIIAYFIIFSFVAQDAAFSIGTFQYSAPIVAPQSHLSLLSLLTEKVYAKAKFESPKLDSPSFTRTTTVTSNAGESVDASSYAPGGGSWAGKKLPELGAEAGFGKKVELPQKPADNASSRILAEDRMRALQVPNMTESIKQFDNQFAQNQARKQNEKQWQDNLEAGVNKAFDNLFQKEQEKQWITRNNGRAFGAEQQLPIAGQPAAIPKIVPPALVKIDPMTPRPYVTPIKPIHIAAINNPSALPEIPKPPETLATVTFPKLNNPIVPIRTTVMPKLTMPTPITINKPGNLNAFTSPTYVALPTTYKFQQYKIPLLINNNALKPITPIFIQPYKPTALPSGLPNTYTTLKPIKPEFVKISNIVPATMPFNQFNPAFNKDLKPVFLPIKNPITLLISQPTMLKPQLVKLDNPLSQAIKPVFPKITTTSPIKQLTPLKPMFNAVTPITAMQSPFDSKLTKMPTPILMPIPKFEALGYNSLTKPSFTMIKPELIKPMSFEKMNPYIIKETGMLSPIKPKFESFTPSLAAKPQWTKMVEVNPTMNPEFIKIGQAAPIMKPDFIKIGQTAPILTQSTLIKPQWIKITGANSAIKPEFAKMSSITPLLTQTVALKPQWETIDAIKPLNIRLDANITKIPQLANTMPKIISVDFNAVKKPEFIKLNQAEAVKVALTQLNPAFNNALKPALVPIKNQTISVNQIVPIKPVFTKLGQATPILTPVSIRPEWIKTTEINPAIKPEFNKLKEITPTLTQPVPIKTQWVTLTAPNQTMKPDFKASPMPEQIPMPEPIIVVKPEVLKVETQNLAKIEPNNNILGFEKILLQQIAPLSVERLVLPAPIKINPVINQELPVPQKVLTESIKAPTPVLAPVNLASVMPKAQTVSAKAENILINPAKINTVPSINITETQITKNNSLQQLAALKPASLVDNYMQQLKTVYEWKKMRNELVYLSQNVETITANEAPVELANINAKITKIKASLDKKAGEVKEILAKNLVEQSILENNTKTIPVSNFPFKDMPVNNNLPQPQLPIDRNLPLNPITLPNVLPRIEGGFMQNLREAFKGNVFALSTDYIEPTTGPDLDNSPRLRNQSPPR